MRRASLLLLALWLLGPIARAAVADSTWPDKPIRLVVGFSAGSGIDLTARQFARKFSDEWKQPVIVDNITGNAGLIGLDKVAKSAPDGYTLMLSGNAVFTILPSLQKLSFDPVKDITPITTALIMPSVLMVNNELPVRSAAELIAYAKANPGKLSYGTPGVGTPQHIAGELFCRLAGIQMVHIPYRGANMSDLMSGVVQVGIHNAGSSLPMTQANRVRALAVTSLKRVSAAPEIPTLAEEGFPAFEAISWFTFVAPAGVPQSIVSKVRNSVLRAMQDDELKTGFKAMGLEIVGTTPEQTRDAIATDLPKWRTIIEQANISLSP